jgi:FlaA1/EpsC-like NDP-sugar epimerase
MRHPRTYLMMLVDSALAASAYALAFLLRYDGALPDRSWDLMAQGLPVVLAVQPLAFLSFGFYRNIWRYASFDDACNIARVATAASLITGVIFLNLNAFPAFPATVLLLDWLLLLLLITASRLALRSYFRLTFTRPEGRERLALIVGAGAAGNFLLKELRGQATSGLQVVGFVDDDPEKQGMYLGGLPVLGRQEDLPQLVRERGINDLIVALPASNGKAVATVRERCRNLGVRVRTLPTLGELVQGQIASNRVPEVEVEHLLGRDPVVLDEPRINEYLRGKVVLVSGAAGSIGSEICRQVARFRPKTLILLDNAETPLFYLERELRRSFPQLDLVAMIGDVKNRDKMEAVFLRYAPATVFHAAAYKHVPMMEVNPCEAVANNIGGTRVLADAARRHGVRDFVLISTDKAVNPTSVMGASKRGAEMYVQALAKESATRFTTVRFGNVLGSNGSVIPLFLEQIRKGEALTVTHPDVVRYFMTIPEASQLVLQAGCLGKGGEIFVLDMGQPVRIVDLAQELIRLSGLVPYQDIDIVFTGLRPGEKLYEELLIAGEGISPTSHGKIRVAAAVATKLGTVAAELESLLRMAERGEAAVVVAALGRLVPEFRGQGPKALPEPSYRLRPALPGSRNSDPGAVPLPLEANLNKQNLEARRL